MSNEPVLLSREQWSEISTALTKVRELEAERTMPDSLLNLIERIQDCGYQNEWNDLMNALNKSEQAKEEELENERY